MSKITYLNHITKCCKRYPRFHYDGEGRVWLRCSICGNRGLTQLNRANASVRWNLMREKQSLTTKLIGRRINETLAVG